MTNEISQPPSSTGALVQALRDPRESRSCKIIYIIAGAVWVLAFGLLVHFLGWIQAGITLSIVLVGLGTVDAISPNMIRTQGVRVSSDQLPTVYRAMMRCAHRLQLTAIPEVYVIQATAWNAIAVMLARRRVVVLYSGVIDALVLNGDAHSQLAFLIGHEFGHHISGHTSLWFRLAEIAIAWCPPLRLWHSRHGEATCDRIGLYCSESLDASLQVIAKLMVGAHLACEVNREALVSHWHSIRAEKKIVRYVSGLEHFPLACRYTELIEAASQINTLFDGTKEHQHGTLMEADYR